MPATLWLYVYMKKIALIVLLIFILSGCASFSPMPSYVVMLTAGVPLSEARCTGVLLSEDTILTADHCSGLWRAVTQDGRESRVVSLHRWPEYDLAIMHAGTSLPVTSYAKLGDRDTSKPGTVWGICPYYFPHNARYVTALGHILGTIDGAERGYDLWYSRDSSEGSVVICGGDSGGVIVQNGKVVGMVSAVLTENLFFSIGHEVYAINGSEIASLIED